MTSALTKLPASGPARETLREKGQFWTPDWVAEAMVGYLLAGGCGELFDPAVGKGNQNAVLNVRFLRTLVSRAGCRILLDRGPVVDDHFGRIQSEQYLANGRPKK